MANICSNKYYISSDYKETIDKIVSKLKDLKIDVEYIDDYSIEGFFDSMWDFPNYDFKDFFNEFTDDTIYMRCLSEEYSCGVVSMNVYSEGKWKDPQYFDF